MVDWKIYMQKLWWMKNNPPEFFIECIYRNNSVLLSLFGQAGSTNTSLWEAMSTTALVNAVINGLGISVLPHRMILPAIERGLVVTIGVKGLRFQRNFYMIHHKDKYLTASTKRFMELCRNYEVDYPFPRYIGLF